MTPRSVPSSVLPQIGNLEMVALTNYGQISGFKANPLWNSRQLCLQWCRGGVAGCVRLSMGCMAALGPKTSSTPSVLSPRVQYIELWRRVHHTPLTDVLDKIRWGWTQDDRYSMRSCYTALFHGSTTSPHSTLTWRTWVPLRIKFFLWLALQDRCWTNAHLARIGLPHNFACAFCDQAVGTM